MNKTYQKINKAFERIKKDMDKRGYCVHAITDVYKDNPLISNWINVHTHGLEKYGVINVSIVAPEDDDRLAHVIYTVADMMKDGEVFDLDAIHVMYNPDETIDFIFTFLRTKCFGEDTLRIVLPDIKTKEFFNYEDYEDLFDNCENEYCLQRTEIFNEYEE